MNNQQLDYLGNVVNDNIESILKEFHILTYKNAQYHSGRCPIHQGKHSNFAYYHNEQKQYKSGRWRCYSKGCHEHFKGTPLGFVRALLSSEKGWRGFGDRIVPFCNVVDWVVKKFNPDMKGVVNSLPQERVFEIPEASIQLSRHQIQKFLSKPPKYFLERGFSPNTLRSFDVGTPIRPVQKFYFREFAPIYDIHNQYCIGAVCRSVFEKCSKCFCYHDPKYDCPDEEWRSFYCKWKNWEFNRAFSLYNLWSASSNIQATQNVVLVEGQGNIWKLAEAGITNCVASYGTQMAWGQEELLRRSGAVNLCLLMDSDEAGEIAFRTIGGKLWQDFNIHKIQIPQEYKDVGEMSSWLIEECLKPQIEKYNRK